MTAAYTCRREFVALGRGHTPFGGELLKGLDPSFDNNALKPPLASMTTQGRFAQFFRHVASWCLRQVASATNVVSGRPRMVETRQLCKQ